MMTSVQKRKSFTNEELGVYVHNPHEHKDENISVEQAIELNKKLTEFNKEYSLVIFEDKELRKEYLS
ncbi:MAG: hypothetical protein IH949_03905 [Bacteroidetes bacterium]|nr:hypothetical protein [Bacteroidota bacterium]